MIFGLERRFQDLLESADLLLELLDALLSFLLRLSEVDKFVNDSFLAIALRMFSPVDYGKVSEERTMFSSSVCRLRRVFTVSRNESFIFLLVVSKVLERLVSSLGIDVKKVPTRISIARTLSAVTWADVSSSKSSTFPGAGIVLPSCCDTLPSQACTPQKVG